MAGMPRLCVHHVTQRGNRRQQAFFDSSDYQFCILTVERFLTGKPLAGGQPGRKPTQHRRSVYWGRIVHLETEMAKEMHWPDLAIELYDKLTGRGAEITYEFDNMEIWVPSGTGEDATQARWKLNGVLKIRARDASQT